jgi:dipeptidyl aminopeptidase/acylaminoacyl peptidase
VDQSDQRWYRTSPAGGDSGAGTGPVALVPEPPDGIGSVRYADGRVTPSGRWLVSVEERSAGGGGHRLIAVPTDGGQVVVPLFAGRDFVSAPRPSPDGRWLAWVGWDHPSMPWDSSEVLLASLSDEGGGIRLGPAVRVAGGDGCSVGQPRWCRDGSLVYVDDRTGWWLPFRLAPERLVGETDRSEALVDLRREFHAPDWALGQSTIDELADGTLVCRMHGDGRDHLVRLSPAPSGGGHWLLQVIEQPCVTIAGVVAGPVGKADPGGSSSAAPSVWLLGSTITEAQGVFEVTLDDGVPAVRRSTAPTVRPARGDVSTARLFEVATPQGTVPGLFFRPANRRVRGQQGESGAGIEAGAGAESEAGAGAAVPGPDRHRGPPPLVVFCHGGPTGAADPGFDPVVQFFTSRGIAVACVDYRGSSGYGREYRRRLDGLWGEADVDDCVGYASALVDAGLVDGSRLAIRGTSAGGLTALGALVRSDRFVGGVAWYGVTDLEALAADTHEFESHYVDSLVGPWPEDAATYRDRSPVNHPDRVSGAVLLLQGADDPVVPADQSERFAEQLRRHRVPCRLTVFEGESHGFRRAETIAACLDAELGFYRSLFGGEG